MSGLPPPWSGLARLAPRLPVEVSERGPAGAAAMLAALPPGPLRAAVEAVPAEPGRWLRADDAAWPPSLVGLPGGPLALQYEGEVSLLRQPGVAVVGTRRCTPTGRRLAREYAQGIVAEGAVVVSGLAAGIDIEAHVAARGRTVAVLGQGLAAAMPAWQAAVRRRILAEGGLVVSELPAAFPAAVWTFPLRNRIIAGLARGVLVVEAGHKSGAKNTAHHGCTFGREVAAVPGLPDLPTFAGCLDLIEEGASIARGPSTIRVLLGLAPGELSAAP